MNKKPRHLAVALLFAFVCLWVVSNLGKWRDPKYWEFDIGGYYSYLPAVFIYHDLNTMDGYGTMEKRYFYTDNKYGYYQNAETGKWVNKYPIGVALMQLPFYLVAHFVASLLPGSECNGYSWPFLTLMMIATVFYSSCGLWYLSRFLNKYFPPRTVMITLILIGFGTNLFIYTTNLPGSSHPFLFFLISALLFYTDSWYKNPNIKQSFIIGLLLGMCLITRPTAGLIIILPLFIFISKIKKSPLKDIMLQLLASVIGLFLVALLQMLYWRETSGHWIYYSYVKEGFDFLHPHIIDGLFSYRKGWFVYTPIAFLGIIGLWQIFKSAALKHYFFPISIYFILVIYVIYSWCAWFYGGSFGARPMVDSYGIVALPLCAFVDRILHFQKKSVRSAFLALFVFFTCLNLFQTFQFQKGIIPWDGVNKKYYWAIFGDIHPSEEKSKLLVNP